MTWDFLQRYDESWIWRCANHREATESSRNFAALEECVADAVLHGYAPEGKAARRAAAGGRPKRRRKAEGPARALPSD